MHIAIIGPAGNMEKAIRSMVAACLPDAEIITLQDTRSVINAIKDMKGRPCDAALVIDNEMSIPWGLVESLADGGFIAVVPAKGMTYPAGIREIALDGPEATGFLVALTMSMEMKGKR